MEKWKEQNKMLLLHNLCLSKVVENCKTQFLEQKIELNYESRESRVK